MNFRPFLENPALTDWRISACARCAGCREAACAFEKEERLLALGSAALDGYDDAFSQLTDVDMKFGVLIDEKGEERPLTQSSTAPFW